MVEHYSAMLGWKAGVVWTLGGVLLSLVLGSVVRLLRLAGQRGEARRSRIASLRTWWILAVLFSAALLLGHGGLGTLFALASVLGLREYLGLTFEMRRDRVADFLAYAAIPVHYLLLHGQSTELSNNFLPLVFFLLLSIRLVMTGTTIGFVYDVSSVFWGLMLTTYCVSHAVRLVHLPETLNPVGGWPGWIIYLVLLTELNDIAQALWGRQFGRHKVTPTISPKKTWEGLLFGMATTVVAAVLIAPLLTPLADLPGLIPWQWAALAGLIIAAGGFFGDVTVSAVKRDVGVKDSGTLLPGQGGMLDRIDSLSFTAPLFYYYLVLVLPVAQSP
jgi:phosphatidate cytidylyltransferase